VVTVTVTLNMVMLMVIMVISSGGGGGGGGGLRMRMRDKQIGDDAFVSCSCVQLLVAIHTIYLHIQYTSGQTYI